MLSRTAESFFWIGRFLERAEYTARFLNVQYHMLLEIGTEEDHIQRWTTYLDNNGQLASYQTLYGEVTTQRVLEFITLNRDNANSLFNLVQMARTHARGIQDQLSSEVWCYINDFFLGLKDQHPRDLWHTPHRMLSHIQHLCYTADGVFGSTMLHDEGWNFYRLGKNIERAIRTARLLDEPVLAKAEPGIIAEHHQCLAILKSASAHEAYRKFYRAHVVPRKIVQFLLFHSKFPRSVRFSTSQIRQLLGRLSTGPRSKDIRETERLAGQLAADLEFGTLEDVYKLGLSTFLSLVLDQIEMLTNWIGRSFFRISGYGDQPAPTTNLSRRPAIRIPETTYHTVRAVLAVRHHFVYHYDSPVMQVRTLMRLAPPQHYGRQRRLDLRWHMDPPADYRHFTDAFGNLVWQLDHARIEKEIACTVEMRVETRAFYHTDGILSLQGIALHESDCTVEPAEFLQLTPLVNRSEALFQVAKRMRARGLPPLELAESILHQVHVHMRYQPGTTHVGTTAAEAFAQGAGVCQDYAHVMLALCRLAGLPARYVSGYLPGEGQMHAWVEVLVSSSQQQFPFWVPFDPTHQRRCDERYITVAIGRDYQDIAPTSGYYSGDAQNRLDVMVSVTMESHGTATAEASVQDPSSLTMEAQDSQQQ
ncbi:MAG: hypothetical protein D6704_02890 [Nitrospirae bacterium]|nr:MAG: hypothetical protein D6704_02890 [Nitrospirota bacterium]